MLLISRHLTIRLQDLNLISELFLFSTHCINSECPIQVSGTASDIGESEVTNGICQRVVWEDIQSSTFHAIVSDVAAMPATKAKAYSAYKIENTGTVPIQKVFPIYKWPVTLDIIDDRLGALETSESAVEETTGNAGCL